MPIRGIRGAVQAQSDTSEAILEATRLLLSVILEENPELKAEDIASALFTMTEDLCAAYPAQAARQMGWESVPLMCAQEISVPGSLPRCIRILIHWNTHQAQKSIRPVYLGAAASLRPEFSRADHLSD
jgi:chorismate mutase